MISIVIAWLAAHAEYYESYVQSSVLLMAGFKYAKSVNKLLENSGGSKMVGIGARPVS